MKCSAKVKEQAHVHRSPTDENPQQPTGGHRLANPKKRYGTGVSPQAVAADSCWAQAKKCL